MIEVILAIDPGCLESGYLFWAVKERSILNFGKVKNEEVEDILRTSLYDACVVEKVQSYGMGAGAELFETCFFTGRISAISDVPIERVSRKTVVAHHCGDAKGNDKTVRAALIERFGEPSVKVQTGVSARGKPLLEERRGKLYGITKDVWSALAIAVWKADKLDPTQGL